MPGTALGLNTTRIARPVHHSLLDDPTCKHLRARFTTIPPHRPSALIRLIEANIPPHGVRLQYPVLSYDFSNSTRAPSTVGQKGTTALHLAAKNGRVDVVQTLLQLKLEVDVQDAQGSTALHVAAAKGYEEIVRTLLASSADIEVEDHEGFTALQLAAMNGHANVVQLLVNGGAAVN
ncbi:Ankyrin repeat-containing protein 40 [Elsinoe fawcettii]|nr:Ankyrin repeat-containing protein 40 [Elsinoe fawcettii]